MARRPPAVARLLERVTATVREHHMLSPGDKVLVAVSGGPDSTCLLHSLYMLRRLLKIKLEVFHFDHRLRPDSGSDARYVRRLASRLGLVVHVVEAPDAPIRGDSVENWARKARLRAALTVRNDTGAARVALGHTMEDQAETVLIALIRGGGLEAVAGIKPAQAWVVHPLLAVRREEVESFCHALRLKPRRDPTNRDTRFLRNAVRLRVIPELERVSGRDVRQSMARSALLLQEDATELRRQTAEALSSVMAGDRDSPALSASALRSLPRPIAARIARYSLYRVPIPPTEEAITAILDLALGRPGRRRDLPGGLVAKREKEYVRLSRTSPGEPVQREKGGSGRERSRRNQGSRVARPGDAS